MCDEYVWLVATYALHLLQTLTLHTYSKHLLRFAVHAPTPLRRIEPLTKSDYDNDNEHDHEVLSSNFPEH